MRRRLPARSFSARTSRTRTFCGGLPMLSIPSVVLSANTKDLPLACVDLDNVGAVRTAVDYLRSLGHRRIGHIGASPTAFDSRERFDAFELVVREAGLDGMRGMVPTDFDWKIGIADVLKSWRGPGFPTAILAGGFGISLHALDALRAMGMSVPGDVSLSGSTTTRRRRFSLRR